MLSVFDTWFEKPKTFTKEERFWSFQFSVSREGGDVYKFINATSYSSLLLYRRLETSFFYTG